MSVSQPGVFSVQEFADAGAPLALGRLYTYATGTTTQKTAYTDAAGLVPHTYTSDGAGGQYIALNSRGELPAPLYLFTDGAYDLALKRSDASTVWTRRADGAASGSDLSASGGAALVGYIGNLTGASLKSLQTKARERLSPENDAGGTGDGVADDSSPVSRVITAAKTWLASAVSTYLIGSTGIAAGKTLMGVWLTGKVTNTDTLHTSGAAVNVKLIGLDLDGSANGIGFQQNTASCSDIAIVGSRVRGKSYGYLVNSNDTSDGGTVVGSVLYADTGDAIELNVPGGASGGFVSVGNVLTGGPNGSGTTSGFAYGVAKALGHIHVGNYAKSARNEAWHFESGQRLGVLAGNVVAAANGEALRALFNTGAQPLVIANNQALHTGTKTGIAGVRLVNDGNGHLRFNVIAGNVMSGFGIGYRQEGSGIQASSDNVAIGCDTAIQVSGFSVWPGRTYANACTALAIGANGALIGKIYSDVNVATPLVKNGTNFPGPTLQGWNMPFTAVHTGSATGENTNICTLPDEARGRLIVQAGSGTNGIFYAVDISWDGTTFAATVNIIGKNNGVPTNVSVVNNGGSLALRFTAASAQSLTARADFTGEWYVHT